MVLTAVDPSHFVVRSCSYAVCSRLLAYNVGFVKVVKCHLDVLRTQRIHVHQWVLSVLLNMNLSVAFRCHGSYKWVQSLVLNILCVVIKVHSKILRAVGLRLKRQTIRLVLKWQWLERAWDLIDNNLLRLRCKSRSHSNRRMLRAMVKIVVWGLRWHVVMRSLYKRRLWISLECLKNIVVVVIILFILEVLEFHCVIALTWGLVVLLQFDVIHFLGLLVIVTFGVHNLVLSHRLFPW